MKLNPQPADPTQAEDLHLMMPIVFTFMLATFPAGLVIYWAWNNVLSIIQQCGDHEAGCGRADRSRQPKTT